MNNNNLNTAVRLASLNIAGDFCRACLKEGESSVLESRPQELGIIRRRRECSHCRRRITTYEIEAFDIEHLLKIAEMSPASISQFRLLAKTLNDHADHLSASLPSQSPGRPSAQAEEAIA